MNPIVDEPCSRIANQIGEMFTCSKVNSNTRIRTPFLYPDGDVIDVFLVEQSGRVAVTDFGESLRWLRTQTVAMKKSPKQKLMIQDVCQTHGIEFRNGTLLTYIDSVKNLTDCVLRLSQAAMRVADIYFTMRTRSIQSVVDEVEDYFKEQHIPFRRDVRVTGKTGKEYAVDFSVAYPEKLSFIEILSTGSRASSRPMIEHAFAMWYDIKGANDNKIRAARRVSVVDDSSDVWESAEFSLLAEVSDAVVRWSKPDELERVLRPAA